MISALELQANEFTVLRIDAPDKDGDLEISIDKGDVCPFTFISSSQARQLRDFLSQFLEDDADISCKVSLQVSGKDIISTRGF